MAKSSNEAFWWSLFSAGGMVAALLVPAHIFLNGIIEPMGSVSITHLQAVAANPLTKLYLFVLLSLPFFHCAHRIRHVLFDLGLKGMQTLVAVLCYGAAIVCTIAAGSIILSI